jgi:hypothetical protein
VCLCVCCGVCVVYACACVYETERTEFVQCGKIRTPESADILVYNIKMKWRPWCVCLCVCCGVCVLCCVYVCVCVRDRERTEFVQCGKIKTPESADILVYNKHKKTITS